MATVIHRPLTNKQLIHTVRLFQSPSKWRRVAQPFRCSERHKHVEPFPQRLSLPETHGYVPTLSPREVNRLLAGNEHTMENKVDKKDPVKSFDSNQLGSNHPIEDRRVIGRLTQTEGQVFGVIDGHGGGACAQSVSERLLDYIAVSLLSPEDLEKYNHSVKTDGPMNLLSKVTFNNDYVTEEMIDLFRSSLHRYVIETLSFDCEEEESLQINSQIEQALRSAVLRLDNDLLTEAQPDAGVINYDSLEAGVSGACACVTHVRGRDVYTANLGDTRAVIGQLSNGRWLPVPLSSDHNIDNEQEAERVRKAHPISEEQYVLKNDRLLGHLVPLRAFGDLRFKWSTKDLQNIVNTINSSYGQGFVLKNYYTPPYLINDPEITHYRLTKNDHFMVLATDGLWEMIPNAQIVRLVGSHLEGRLTADRFSLDHDNKSVRKLCSINQHLIKRKTGLASKSIDTNSATHLIRNALGREHRKVSEMLTFPPEMSRYYRDDITVIVVYFDTSYAANEE